jgi:hypothetical protein
VAKGGWQALPASVGAPWLSGALLLPWSIGSGEFGSHGNDPEWRGGVVDMFDHDGGDVPWLPISSLEAPSRSLLPTPIFKLLGETTNHWIGRRRRWWWCAPTWERCLRLLFLGEFAMEGKWLVECSGL